MSPDDAVMNYAVRLILAYEYFKVHQDHEELTKEYIMEVLDGLVATAPPNVLLGVLQFLQGDTGRYLFGR